MKDKQQQSSANQSQSKTTKSKLKAASKQVDAFKISQNSSDKKKQKQIQIIDTSRQNSKIEAVSGVASATIRKKTLKQDNVKVDLKVEQIDLKKHLTKKKIWKPDSKFQGVTDESADTEVCQYSFRIIKYPDEERFISQNKKCVTIDQREILYLYQLVYCVDCCIPVYWMCLSENTPVEKVNMKGKNQKSDSYLVFQCESCSAKALNYKKSIQCLECHSSEGYMTKILEQNPEQEKSAVLGWVHPICALSFPNIYQIGSPRSMKFKFQSQINFQNDVLKTQTKNLKTCEICDKSTPRTLNCSCEGDEIHNAHAFCIMNQNKELVYQCDGLQQFDYEEQMDQKWSLQFFLKDSLIADESQNTDDQSNFMRVLCNDQRSQTTLCHCENSAADRDNLSQCQACHNWYHQTQDCWGDHVDLDTQGGASKAFIKKNNQVSQSKDMDELLLSTLPDEKQKNLNILDSENEEDIEMSVDENEEDKQMEEQGEDEHSENRFMHPSDNFFLICDKCMTFNDASKGLLDVILNRKTIDDFLLILEGNWSLVKTLYGHPNCDFRNMSTYEFSIFEHVMLYKFWYKLLEQAYRRKLHIDLYNQLLDLNSTHIFNIQHLQNLTQKKLSDSVKIDQEIAQSKTKEYFFFQDVFKSIEENVFAKKEDNIKANWEEKQKVQKYISDHLHKHQIITNKTSDIFSKFIEAEILEKIANVYEGNQAESSFIKSLINQLRKLPTFDHTQSMSFRKLEYDYSIYLKWENKVVKMVNESKCRFDTLKIHKDIKKIEMFDLTPKGQAQSKYEFIKQLFQNKMSIGQVELLIEEGQKLFIQNCDILERLKENMKAATNMSIEIEEAKSHAKPLIVLTENIAMMTQMCIKPQDINDILAQFKESQELRLQTQYFLTDKIGQNKEWALQIIQKGQNPDDIIQKYSNSHKKSMKDKYKQFVYKENEIDMLKERLTSKSLFIDDKIMQDFKDKIKLIEKIKMVSFEYVKREECTMEEILEFIKRIDHYENIDLEYQRILSHKKLSIMRVLDGTMPVSRKISQKDQEKGGEKLPLQSFMNSDVQILQSVLDDHQTESDLTALQNPESDEVQIGAIYKDDISEIDNQQSRLSQSPSKFGAKNEELSNNIDYSTIMKAIRILETRPKDPVNFPLEQTMMLNAKIQAAVDLKKEFQQIIDQNSDSFNQQMIQDMKKCVQKAWKEHGVQMTQEKQIIENLKYSEEWFMQAYSKLKNAVGGASALVDVDFKEFTEVLGCIESKEQINDVLIVCNQAQSGNSSALSLQKQNSSSQIAKQHQLVCAAKNLHLSLMRCAWMVEVQNMIGKGRFAQTEVPKDEEKDIIQVCKLSEGIKELELETLVNGFESQDEDYREALKQMKELSSFSTDFKKLFGHYLQLNFTQPSIFDRITELIYRCETIQTVSTPVLSLQKSVNALDHLYQDVKSLAKKREELNISLKQIENISPEMQPNLANIIQQAEQYVLFSSKYTAMKLKNAPNHKLKIGECQQLLKEAQDEGGENQDKMGVSVIYKLQKSIRKYEKLHRNYEEYERFKRRQQERVDEKQFIREQSELRFTQQFVEGLIEQAEVIDIDVYNAGEGHPQYNQKIDVDNLKKDLTSYEEFRTKFVQLMRDIEEEIFDKQTHQAIQDIKERGLENKFYDMRTEITRHPIYDKQTFKRIRAFIWIFNAYELIANGSIDKDSPFNTQTDSHVYMSIKQQKDFIKFHSNFLQILPELKNHSIVQQLLWRVQQAQDIVDDVKELKQNQQYMINLYNKGPDFYRQQILEERENQKKTFVPFKDSHIGKRLQDMSNHVKNGVIGPAMQKERLINHFKKKPTYQEFLDKRAGAEEMKINVADELRFFNKQIQEHEDILKFKTPNVSNQIKDNLIKQIGGSQSQNFAYQPLFEAYDYEKLQNLAKQVFISPIQNWSIFNMLKKRLEIAYDIKKDLGIMLRELDSKKQKMNLSRVQPYFAQYWESCRVRGHTDIDRMISAYETSKNIINDLKIQIQQSQSLLKSDTLEQAIQKMLDFKAQHSKSRFNFEEMEEKLRVKLWIFEGKVLELSYEKLNESQEDLILSELTVHILEYNKFKLFTTIEERLKCTKYLQKSTHEKDQKFLTWFTDIFQTGFQDHIEKVKTCETLESFEDAKNDKSLVLKLVNLKQFYENKEHKIKNPTQKQESSSSSSEDGSGGSSSSSDSEESGEQSVSQGISVDSASSVGNASISDDDIVSDSSSQEEDEQKEDDEGSDQQIIQKRPRQSKQEKLELKKQKKLELRKRVKKDYEKNKKKEEDRRKQNLLSGNKDIKISQIVYSDRMYQDMSKRFQQQIRDGSYLKMKKLVDEIKEKYHLKLKKEMDNDNLQSQLSAMVKQVEDKCYQMSFSKTDDNYTEKISTVLRNLKFLLQDGENMTDNFSILCDHLFCRKTINLFNLTKAHPNFREYATLQQQKFINSRKKRQEPLDYFDQLLAPEKSAKLQSSLIDLNQKTVEKVEKEQIIIPEQEPEEDSNSAVFSDPDEEDHPMKEFEEKQQKTQQQNEYDPFEAMQSSKIQMSASQNQDTLIDEYDPLDNQPVLYDPLNGDFGMPEPSSPQIQQEQVPLQSLNFAEPGNLLKLWTGSLNVLGQMNKGLEFGVSFYSCQDIKEFHQIPDWPVKNNENKECALQLKGTTSQGVAFKYFRKLQNDGKKVLKGWVILDQQNKTCFERFSKHFTTQQQDNKCSIFTLYESQQIGNQEIKDVNIYLMPITQDNHQFCLSQLGANPPFQNQMIFAFFINIKHPFYTDHQKMQISKSGLPSLNPTPVQNLQSIIKQEPDAEIDQLIEHFRQTNAGVEEIMNAYQTRNLSKQGIEKLQKFVQDLIEQTKQDQMRRQHEINMQQMIKQEDQQQNPPQQQDMNTMYQEMHYDQHQYQPHQQQEHMQGFGEGYPQIHQGPPSMIAQPPVMQQHSMVEQLIHQRNLGQLTPEQDLMLNQMLAQIQQQQQLYQGRGSN